MVDEWLQHSDDPFFAAGAGKVAVDAVYKAAVVAEDGLGKGLDTGTALLDIEKFYENMRHPLLVYKVFAQKWRMRILRVNVRVYRFPWFICIANVYLAGISPEQGIVARCTMADINVRLVCREGLASLVARTKICKFDLYYDDLTIQATGAPIEIKSWLAKAVGDADIF